MEFLYPKKNEVILLPKALGNSSLEVVFKLAHQRPETEVHWYLDQTYIGSTSNIHEMLYATKPGNYTLTAVDTNGNRVQQSLEVQKASKE